MNKQQRKMQANCWQFRLLCGCGSTKRGASLNTKPLDAPPSSKYLRRIIPVAAMVDEFVETTQNTNKTQLLASNYSYGTN
jgi:hypothetical protein